jgi:hypothetical protein
MDNNRFCADVVFVSLVIFHKVGFFKPEIIPHRHLVIAQNELDLLVTEELADLWTDENTLFGLLQH